MKVTDKEIYETKVYTIETEDGEGYVVTMHDPFMDFTTEKIQVVDSNNNEIDNEDLIRELLNVIKDSEN